MTSTSATNRAGQAPESQTRLPIGQLGCKTDHSILSDLQCYMRDYVQQQPEKAAMVCIGIGFILGWKLKPW